MKIDYEYLCQNLGHITGLPVRVYRSDILLYSCHSVEFTPDTVELIIDKIHTNPFHAAFYCTPEFLFFGSIKVKNTKLTIVIGPTFEIKPAKEFAYDILRALSISRSRFDELRYYLENTPNYPMENFVQILCFLNYSLNNEKLSISDLLSQGTTSIFIPDVTIPKPRDRRDPAEESLTDAEIHNTYQEEKEMLSYISTGQTGALLKLFSGPASGRAGKIANDQLRQKKNTFICAATLASRAAIAGGLSHEAAFTLSDSYIQHVELLNDFQAITKLNIEMIFEFTKRVENLKCKGSRSKLVIDVIRYVSKNLNSKITTSDIAKNLGVSRTYLCERFKTEMDTTINEFITEQKVEEAKRLLCTTDRSISSISEGLDFSSQSYFQNVFRKITGKTPGKYRLEKL